MSATSTRHTRAAALDVCREVLAVLTPACERVIVAGSLRRRKADVGDIEIVYIPHTSEVADPGDLFGKKIPTNLVDLALAGLLAAGTIAKRPNVLGLETWGEQNKLARHVASGIGVDIFTATRENWWNYLVCRTGGAATNKAIASAAQNAGWQWCPYGPGFRRNEPHGKGPEWSTWRTVGSEREVFEFVGIPYQEPWERA